MHDEERELFGEEVKGRKFARTYVDNEQDDEEQKVPRSRDTLPFGMNIKQAAHKAAFGKSNNALSRYSSFHSGKGGSGRSKVAARQQSLAEKPKSAFSIDNLDLTDSSSSDSLSDDSDADPKLNNDDIAL